MRRVSPALDQKITPAQSRSTDTVQKIKRAAAYLLGDVGFERLSTNMICAQAQITPPALYRYFPNKYAVLAALADDMMTAQGQAWRDFVQRISGFDGLSVQWAAAITAQYDVIETTPGGPWIMRALYSTPHLMEHRRAAHDRMSTQALLHFSVNLPGSDPIALRQTLRLSIEMMNCALMYICDHPGADKDAIINEMAITLSGALSQHMR